MTHNIYDIVALLEKYNYHYSHFTRIRKHNGDSYHLFTYVNQDNKQYIAGVYGKTVEFSRLGSSLCHRIVNDPKAMEKYLKRKTYLIKKYAQVTVKPTRT